LYSFCAIRFDALAEQIPYYQIVAAELDIETPFITELSLAKKLSLTKLSDFRRLVRGGTDGDEVWKQAFEVITRNRIGFFPSNSVRSLMWSSNEHKRIRADDIAALLTHFSESPIIKDYMVEGLRYHFPDLLSAKRKVNMVLVGQFKSSVVAPLGVSCIFSSKGRTWRPLNALNISQDSWNGLGAISSLVSSSAQDKLVLRCALAYIKCEMLTAKDYGIKLTSLEDPQEAAIVPVAGPIRRSFEQAPTSSSASFFSPGPNGLLGETLTPIQTRESRLPPMPGVFAADDLSMPVAAIIELVCSTYEEQHEHGGSGMDFENLGFLLRSEVDKAFFELSLKNPLNQRVITTADLGALARRLDSHHNRASALEKNSLLAAVAASRLKAVTLLEEASTALGTSTSFAPPVDMSLFDYYRLSEPFRARLDSAATAGGVQAPFDFKAARFPAKKQGFAVQKNLDHKAAAILRAIMYETHVSQAQFQLQWSYWHLFFMGEPPDKDDLRSAWSLRMRFQQLDERDRVIIVEELTELIHLHPLTRFAYMSDATHFANGEKLIREFTYPHVPEVHGNALGVRSGGGGSGDGSSGGACDGDVEEGAPSSDEEDEESGGGDFKASPEKRTPRSHFLSISDTASKGAADTADASLMSMRQLIGDFVVRRLIGGTVDHAALSEIRQLRFLKRPGVDVWPMLELDTPTTGVELASPPRLRARRNGRS
jgi:hypothetical protein